MYRIITRLAVAVPLTALSLYVSAQAGNPAAPDGARADLFQHMLQKMDTNGDGRISLDEYLAAATVRFKSIDSQNKGTIDAADIASSPEAIKRIDHRANALVRHLDSAGNGYITPDEFVAGAQKRFARLDKNSDGKLTPDELAGRWTHGGKAQASGNGGKFAQFAQSRFDKLDANHDGVVTLDEYVAAAKALYAQLDTQHNGKVTASEIASSPRAQERAVHVADRLVKHMDTNGDGVVSQDEFLAAAKTRFARIDKDADGFIDAGEVTARRWAHNEHTPPQG
jgi:Ca2+-binding EF-hand superfamily protein